MKKFSLTLLFFLMVFSVFSASAFGKSHGVTSDPVTVYESKGDPNAKVEFFDEKLSNSGGIGTQDTGRLVYKRSEYTVASNTITGYNVGPRENDVFLVSVPKGVTKTMTDTKEVHASVSYQSSVSADIMKVINLSLVFNAQGSFSNTWSKSTTYSGPTGAFTTRDYYGAIQYDQYNNVVDRYDIYDEYIGTSYLGETRSFAGTTYVNGTKKPKAIEYYRDFNN